MGFLNKPFKATKAFVNNPSKVICNDVKKIVNGHHSSPPVPLPNGAGHIQPGVTIQGGKVTGGNVGGRFNL